MTGGLPPTRTSRLRKLSDEEIELWTQIAAGVKPLPGSSLPAPLSARIVAAEAMPAPPRQSDPLASVKSMPSQPAPPPFAPIERTLKRKLSRGRMTADAAVDLHGLRQDEAYGVLRQFLGRAQQDGARVVLVVTGKGSRGSESVGLTGGAGVLRRSVPLWLALPDFRPLVIGFEEAGRPHGGAGALYIRVRRRLRP